ncbi:DUF2569 family protein [Bradyrhizobium diazoefficiens]|nr:DUF2569 family protein [Bradyrhizobium diazoefficiens]MBR0847106.1 DUF2569 family protein [Bradyrhizobium diazoefficiens]
MTDLWYYAEGGQPRGPLSLVELIPLLARISDPRHVKIWRHGFEDWKAVEDVREVAQQLFRPPPLTPAPPPLATVREPVVTAEEAGEFRNVKPELTGIGGWLGLLAFGQVMGILRLIVSVGQYMQSISDDTWKRFPTAIWGELVMNAGLICLCIYTASLLFSHSRRFPSFFIAQMACAILLPLVDLFWIASIISISLNRPIGEFLSIEPREGGQMIAGAIGAAIWIPYVLRSRRVANTFIK